MGSTNTQWRQKWRVGMLAGLSLLASMTAAVAVVDDAYSFAMETALPDVEKGVEPVQDYWKGQTESSQPFAIKHQFFKGLKYVCWLGIGSGELEDVKLTLIDSAGKAEEMMVEFVHSEDGKRIIGARFVISPSRTGAWTLKVSVTTKGAEPTSWALAYGYE